MLVKVKQQNDLTPTPLNNDTTIKSAYINRSGVIQTFESLSSLKLYSFDTINDVTFEVVSTSTYNIIVSTPTSGNVIVTAEDNSIKTYGYTIETIPYTYGLPIITSVTASGDVCKIIEQPTPINVLSTNWNVGKIARPTSNQIDAITVQDGSWTLLDVSTDYDSTELQYLYNGIDKYIKIYRIADVGSSDHSKHVYFKIVENSNLFTTTPIVTPTRLPYSNQIGYWNFGVFIPLVSGLNIEEIYNKSNLSDLTTYLTTNNITYHSVLFSDLDVTFDVSKEHLNWNSQFDKGFVLDDVLNFNITTSDKFIQIIERDFIDVWNDYKLTQTFTSIDDEYSKKASFKIKWLADNNMDAIYEWFNYIDGGDINVLMDAIKGTIKSGYIIELQKSFKLQLTYPWMLKHLNENDVNFFINRLEYFKTIYTSYKSDVMYSDVLGMLNVFKSLENVFRLNTVLGTSTATANMKASIDMFSNNIHSMSLKSPF